MSTSESVWTITDLGAGWELRIATNDLYPPQLDGDDALIQFREGGDMDLYVSTDELSTSEELTVPGYAMSALVRAFAEYMNRRGGE